MKFGISAFKDTKLIKPIHQTDFKNNISYGFDNAAKIITNPPSKMTSIDINFNVFSDTPKGKDPDSYSPTLRMYHQKLWSKKFSRKDKFVPFF